MTKKTTADKRGHRGPLSVAVSHERFRAELGATPPMPPAADAVPFQDVETGRIVDGAAAARRRWVKERAKTVPVVTLDPTTCPSWLAPSVRDGVAYVSLLAIRFPDPALSRLVLDCASAHTYSVALRSIGDAKSLTEARAWVREHRACLRELACLAGLARQGAEKRTPADLEREMREAGRPRTREGSP